MKISALHRLTLLDFPGHIACIAFLPGCNFRCHYCHNADFVLPERLKKISQHFLSQEDFFQFLKTRKNLLEGVVISGGEPTIHSDLPDFLRAIRDLGFKRKLDTNGTHPEMLSKILQENLVDYVAMDIKSSEEKYSEFCGTTVSFSAIEQSKKLLEESSVKGEFRTTLIREFHDEGEFLRILQFIQGAKKYILQNFQNRGGTLNPQWKDFSGFSEKELQQRKKQALKYVKNCEVRA